MACADAGAVHADEQADAARIQKGQLTEAISISVASLA
jgi:hypothetical protein